MKPLFVLLTLVLASVLPGLAQTKGTTTVTLSGASPQTVVVSWAAPVASGSWAGCTTAAPCTYVVSVLAGACPSTVVGSSGWLQFTPVSALTLTDTTETPGATVSYVVTTVQNGFNAAPSNCASYTVPLDPSPATGLTVGG
jgi:hypothetical protein